MTPACGRRLGRGRRAIPRTHRHPEAGAGGGGRCGSRSGQIPGHPRAPGGRPRGTRTRLRTQVFHSRAATRRARGLGCDRPVGIACPAAAGGPLHLHRPTSPKRHEGFKKKEQRAGAVGGGRANKTAVTNRHTLLCSPFCSLPLSPALSINRSSDEQLQVITSSSSYRAGGRGDERSARGHRRRSPERAQEGDREGGERRRRASRLAAARIPAPVRAVMAWWRKKVVTPARRAWAAVSTRVRARNTGTPSMIHPSALVIFLTAATRVTGELRSSSRPSSFAAEGRLLP